MIKFIKKIIKPKDLSHKLPSRKDFGYGLDENQAWKNFGKLSIEQAYDKFCENPESYQEDFMWMDWKAFEYYLPVLERYLSEVTPDDPGDDGQAWIIGCGVDSQLESFHSQFSELTLKKIKNLCELVLIRFSEFELDDDIKQSLQKKWKEAQKKISKKA